MSAGEEILFDSEELLQQTAAQMAADAQVRRQGGPVQHSAPPVATLTPTPPSSPVMSERDMREAELMREYAKEKKKLETIYQQLLNLSHGDKCGDIIRNFGLSQVVIQVGNAVDRTNGLVLLRSLKATASSKALEGKTDVKNGEYKKISSNETIVTSLYEVWGLMEDGSIGLTASYAPDKVAFVVSLKSGLDQPPGIDIEDEED